MRKAAPNAPQRRKYWKKKTYETYWCMRGLNYTWQWKLCIKIHTLKIFTCQSYVIKILIQHVIKIFNVMIIQILLYPTLHYFFYVNICKIKTIICMSVDRGRGSQHCWGSQAKAKSCSPDPPTHLPTHMPAGQDIPHTQGMKSSKAKHLSEMSCS